jgi:surface polysaccharide O-acyltransferase-like enzyme
MHLYFVFVLIQFFIIYQWISPRLTDNGWLRITFVAAFLSLCFYLVSEFLLLEKGADLHFFEWYYGKAFVGWSVFFFWGCWLGRNPWMLIRLSKRIGWLGLLTVLTLAAFYAETYREISAFGYNARQYFLLSGLFFQWTAANFVLAGLYRLDQPDRPKPWLNRLATRGQETFGIYLSHLVFIIGLVQIRKAFKLEAPPYLLLPLLFGLTWVLSWALIQVFRIQGGSLLRKILFGSRP